MKRTDEALLIAPDIILEYIAGVIGG